MTDGEVLQGEELVVTLMGREYRWKAPVRRVSRQMLRRLMKLEDVRARFIAALGGEEKAKEYEALAKAGKVDETPDLGPECLEPMCDLADGALDFFYEFHGQMRQDRQTLDDAPEIAILNVFKEVAAFVSAPFVTQAGSVNPQSETNTGNPAPTS